jgi:hypothetical protein
MNRWNRLFIRSFLSFGIVLVGVNAGISQAVDCAGLVYSVLIDSSGNVSIYPTFRNAFIQVCNVQADWKGVSQTTCLSWLNSLRSATEGAAQISNTNSLNLVVGYPNIASCTAIAGGSGAPAPTYINLRAK